jgi:LmbE family N-acetylglucosaminyl deacetylase
VSPTTSTRELPALDLRRVLVVSPHFDDAVLSCGHLIAAAEDAWSVTVFGAAPSRYPEPPTAWDRACGFASGDDVCSVRRAEDLAAVTELGATPVVLDFVDHQYRGGAKVDLGAITDAMAPLLDDFRPTLVAVPLAIQHPDHRASTLATLSLRRRGDARDWLCYAEFPYVWREPDLAVRRLGWIRRHRLRVTPAMTRPVFATEKAAALRAYRSQLQGLELGAVVDDVASAPEQLWQLSDRSPLPVRALRWAGYRTGILR